MDLDGILPDAKIAYPVSDSPEEAQGKLSAASRMARPEAWNHLVRRYAALVCGVARRYGLNDEEVANVFQAVCMEFWEHFDSVHDTSVLKRWLVVVASRKAWQIVKGRDGWTTGISEEAAEPLVSALSLSPEELAVANSDAEQIRTVLERLTSRDRELVWYLFFDPTCPTYQAIAARLGVGTDTIGPLRTRCLKRLRWLFAEHMVSPGRRTRIPPT